MNSFQITGYVRAEPEYVNTQKGITFFAFIITREHGNQNFPIYVKDKRLIEMVKTLKVGEMVNVEGSLLSENVLKGYFIGLRLYLLATRLEIVNTAKVEFKHNIILSKLLEVQDTEDLFRKRKVKKNDK